ncbi:MAG: aldo/keto reductase [Cyclobacteriaceae bacterium]|nr:aldo/keto reductase [Cyclobacteriaceae bacterium]
MEKLQYKAELGKTGLKVPPIIFGTSALGNLYKALTDETKLEIISNWFQWVDSPVVIDTAGKYGAGLALEEIGNGLRALNVRPDDIIISNKLGWLRTELIAAEPTFETGVWVDLKNDAVQKISYDGIMECYEQGLQLLGGSYNTEILSVHDPDEYLGQAGTEDQRRQRMNDILEAYHALFELKKQRKATAIGIGSKDWKIIKLISEKVELDWVMLA